MGYGIGTGADNQVVQTANIIMSPAGNIGFTGSMPRIQLIDTTNNRQPSIEFIRAQTHFDNGPIYTNWRIVATGGQSDGAMPAVDGGNLGFYRNGGGFTGYNMVMTYDGNVGIGTTNPAQRLTVNATGQVPLAVYSSVPNDMIQIFGNTGGSLTTAVYVMPIRIGSTLSLRGGIYWDGPNTNLLYVNTSDYRLKENVVPMQHGLSRIMSLNPVTYNWIEHKMAGEGFIAHEVQSVIPMAVSGEKDAIDKNGAIIAQGVDPSKIVVHLVSGMQEQQTIIQQQASEINELKVQLTAITQRLAAANIP